ncbi:hypothetical protein SAMN05920897_10897 [Alkalispirochaeta americana]|uniref:Arsenical resistance operon trans-acting repressor ArsD n=1 Tax=Alkalispirochaeta americana TaxID=159291 RepID=A0A1N6SIA1_9SPIO|nr:hypothetical protein [Alkalispirochaeta americana]SIQ40885.1 hypothetical protein SAMN05920897_10897 [Alkalispirochaeta americana]
MNAEQVVRIFVPPTGECAGDNTWEKAARGIEERLRRRTGIKVRFETIYLFSPEFFAHPEVAQLIQSGQKPPIIMVNNRIIQAGGKLRERTIREALEG